jgi:hypothetical protein
MVNDHVAVESRLAALANLKAQLQDHADDSKKFSDAEETTNNEGLKRFAAETLPILHARLAEAIRSAFDRRAVRYRGRMDQDDNGTPLRAASSLPVLCDLMPAVDLMEALGVFCRQHRQWDEIEIGDR